MVALVAEIEERTMAAEATAASLAIADALFDFLLDVEAGKAKVLDALLRLEKGNERVKAGCAEIEKRSRDPLVDPAAIELAIEHFRRQEDSCRQVNKHLADIFEKLPTLAARFGPSISRPLRPLIRKTELLHLERARIYRDVRWALHAILAEREGPSTSTPELTEQNIDQLLGIPAKP